MAEGADRMAATDGADDDDDLMARTANGDRQAFTLLVERYQERASRMARSLTMDATEADDLTQEVFLKIWTGAGRWRRGSAQLATWIYRVARNLSIDRHRKQSRMTPIDTGDTEHLPDPAGDGLTAALEAERRQELTTALRGLPERQLTAIVLTYQERKSNAEAAAAMGLSVKALEALLVRARRQLRRRLAEDLAKGDAPKQERAR